jgi:hypothetical protein
MYGDAERLLAGVLDGQRDERAYMQRLATAH